MSHLAEHYMVGLPDKTMTTMPEPMLKVASSTALQVSVCTLIYSVMHVSNYCCISCLQLSAKVMTSWLPGPEAAIRARRPLQCPCMGALRCVPAGGARAAVQALSALAACALLRHACSVSGSPAAWAAMDMSQLRTGQPGNMSAWQHAAAPMLWHQCRVVALWQHHIAHAAKCL